MQTIPRIGKLMTLAPHTIEKNAPLAAARDLMREHRVRHLPVLDTGRIVGVLSDGDIKLAQSLFPDEKGFTAGDVMTESPYTVDSEAPADEVLREMGLRKYGCVIIRNEKNRPIGIFTASDAVQLLGEMLSHIGSGQTLTAESFLAHPVVQGIARALAQAGI